METFVIPSVQILDTPKFMKLCVNQKTGRCAIYLDLNKMDAELEMFKDATSNFETVFYEFHRMWGDVQLAKKLFNFPQVDMSKSPWVVILDVREKVLMPKHIEKTEDIAQIFKMMDQPAAMSKLKESMETGSSPLAAQKALESTAKATHTEL